jgi:cellobiose phosphorylase
MYRLILESLLGLKREADRLRFQPCLPREWASISIDYRYGATTYRILMRQTEPEATALAVTVDGIGQPDAAVSLVDDGVEHHVEVLFSSARDSAQPVMRPNTFAHRQ